jgi:hypothetical protein
VYALMLDFFQCFEEKWLQRPPTPSRNKVWWAAGNKQNAPDSEKPSQGQFIEQSFDSSLCQR